VTALPAPYAGRTVFVGDLHNHCGISYGHGTVEDAYANAALQLDFASVTGHAWWHDMPSGETRLDGLVRYHREGFERLARMWPHVQDVTDSVHQDGRFVSFLSFEWHSMTYGDYCVYYRGPRGDLLRADGLAELREGLRRSAAAGAPAMALPHHIGYRRGRRGVNWSAFDSELSPVAEIVSMHGCGESDSAPRPYLHTMGPRDVDSMVDAGLRAGHRFGFIGSTDHHSAHPGSHGYGRVAVWAPELTRASIWEAIATRSCYALTGDRIQVSSTVNGVPMGGQAAAAGQRDIAVRVVGMAELDYVEVVRSGQVVSRTRPAPTVATDGVFRGTVGLTVGWGEVGVEVPWTVRLRIEAGRLLSVQPRLHGEDVVEPQADHPARYRFSDWKRDGADAVLLTTVTRGNPTPTSDATQGLALEISGDLRTRVVAEVNGSEVGHAVGDLLSGPRTGYLGGFLSGAYRFDRAVPDAARTLEVEFTDQVDGAAADWYYVRVRQVNDQWAWTSPTWIG
jgi:hypothetical protein